MASKLEKDCEQWVVDFAWKTYGVQGIKMNLQGRVSEPDRLFLFHSGKPLYIEFKRKGKMPTPLQAHRAEILRGWGYTVETCDNREHGKKLIEDYASGAGGTKALGAKELPTSGSKILPIERMRRNMGRPRSR